MWWCGSRAGTGPHFRIVLWVLPTSWPEPFRCLVHGQDAGSHFLPRGIPKKLKLSFQGFCVINTPDDVSVLSVWVPSPLTFQRLLSLDLLGPHHRFMCTANYWSRSQSPHLMLAPRRPVPSIGTQPGEPHLPKVYCMPCPVTSIRCT